MTACELQSASVPIDRAAVTFQARTENRELEQATISPSAKHVGAVCRKLVAYGSFLAKTRMGSDVTAYAWDDSGQHIFVSTSAIYGNGEVNVLDLGARRPRKLFPKSKNDPLLSKLRQVCFTKFPSVDSAIVTQLGSPPPVLKLPSSGRRRNGSRSVEHSHFSLKRTAKNR